MERLLPEDASGRVPDNDPVPYLLALADPGPLGRALRAALRHNDSDALGDAIGRAVVYAIRDAERDAGSLCICDPFGGSDPQSCPNCFDGSIGQQHRSLSSGTADDWHGMDRPQGRR